MKCDGEWEEGKKAGEREEREKLEDIKTTNDIVREKYFSFLLQSRSFTWVNNIRSRRRYV